MTPLAFIVPMICIIVLLMLGDYIAFKISDRRFKRELDAIFSGEKRKFKELPRKETQ